MRNRSNRDELPQSITAYSSLDDVNSLLSSKYNMSSSQQSHKVLDSNRSGRKRRRKKKSYKYCLSFLLKLSIFLSLVLLYVYKRRKNKNVDSDYDDQDDQDDNVIYPPVVQLEFNEFVDDSDEEALWVGRISDDRKQLLKSELEESNKKMKVTLVIAHCDLSLNWIWTDYIHDMNDNYYYEIKEIYIYTKCSKPVEGIPPHVGKILKIIELPNVGRNDHSFAYHINHSVLPQRNDSGDNGIIVFLKDNPYRLNWNPKEHDDYYAISDKDVRSFQDLLEIAWVNGFGCAEQALLSYGIVPSYYFVSGHVGWFSLKSGYARKLRDRKENKFTSKYEDMEEWLRKQLGIAFREPYTPVCLGGMFSTTTQQIRLVHESIPTLFQNMMTSVERGDNIEEGHYCERSWAGLFTKSLSEKAISILNSKRTIEKCLQRPWYDRCGNIGYFSSTQTQERNDDDWNGIEIEEYIKEYPEG